MPVVSVGKYIFFKYIYISRIASRIWLCDEEKRTLKCSLFGAFVDQPSTKSERDLLRNGSLDHWYAALIGRSKTRKVVALARLVGQT